MGQPIRIALYPLHIQALAAGKTLTPRVDELEIELVPREAISGDARSFSISAASLFSNGLSGFMTRTIRWYLDSGATFLDANRLPWNRGDSAPEYLTDPNQIVRRETTCLCLWHTTKKENAGKPSRAGHEPTSA